MRSGVIAPPLLSNSWEHPGCGSRASKVPVPAQISSAREKRQTPRLRTANIVARADRQSMDDKADFATKSDKQVSLA